ncbi:MAG: hypothetical protein GXP14_02225 [Gammaproteobacteria bacterium]|nr:hypothetical protein [Gammaproteobacteria bacterium]
MSTKDNIMTQLSMNDFATSAQLAAFCDVQLPAISKATRQLQSQSMIVTEAGFRPAVLRLSFKGARMMGKTLPSGKRSPSAAVQQHACHKNEAALILSRKYPGFQWTQKDQLLAHGLRPAQGEHAATDRRGRAHLILLDDYQMASNRILRSWTRRHTPDTNHYPVHNGQRWCDLANNFVVATTSVEQADRHQQWASSTYKILKQEDARLPEIEIIKIEPLWDLF